MQRSLEDSPSCHSFWPRPPPSGLRQLCSAWLHSRGALARGRPGFKSLQLLRPGILTTPWVLEWNTLGRKQRKGEDIRSTTGPRMIPCGAPTVGAAHLRASFHFPTPPCRVHLTVHLEGSGNGLWPKIMVGNWWTGDLCPRLPPWGLALLPRPGCDTVKSEGSSARAFFKIIFNVSLIIFLPHLPDKSSK